MILQKKMLKLFIRVLGGSLPNFISIRNNYNFLSLTVLNKYLVGVVDDVLHKARYSQQYNRPPNKAVQWDCLPKHSHK